MNHSWVGNIALLFQENLRIDPNHYLIVILFLIFPYPAFASDYFDYFPGTDSALDGYYVVSGFNEPHGRHRGAELSYLYFANDHLGFKVSGVIYIDKVDPTIHELFSGYSLTGFYHINQMLNPYLGLGMFSGSTSICTNDEIKNKSCAEEYLLAIYPEFGIAFNLWRLHISPYIRRYLDTRSSLSAEDAYGLNIGFRF